jgi:hypothetical protein
MDGIRLDEAIRYASTLPSNASTHDLCAKIKNETSSLNLENRSLLSSIKHELRTSHLVQKADYFITYAWNNPVNLTLKAVLNAIQKDKHSQEEVFIWMDVFCVDQHQAGLGNLDFKHWEMVFGESLKGIGKAIVVLSPLKQPIYPTRAWCVFELFTIFQNNISHVVENMYGFNEFNLIFSSINIEAAKATSNEDLIKILTRLREIGAINVNNLLMDVMKKKMEDFHRLSLERIQLNSLEESGVLNSLGEFYDALVRYM